MEIKGSISQMLKGLENANVSKDLFVGKPINDPDGNKIGVITKIDINNDTWYGRVSKNIFLKLALNLLESDKKGEKKMDKKAEN